MCHYVHVSEDERAVCGPEGVGMCMYFPDIGTHTCRYFCSNTWTYLLYVSLSACIFVRNTCTYCAGYGGFLRRFSAPVSARFLRQFLRGCIAVCAVALQSHCRRIAIASPHRIGAASRRCTKCRRLADFIRITFASGPADSLQKKWSLWAKRR